MLSLVFFHTFASLDYFNDLKFVTMNQKNLYVLAMLLFVAFQIRAGVLELQNGKFDNPVKGPHDKAPIVDLDCDVFIIRADTTYNNARVVVKDKVGQVLHDGVMDITHQPNAVYVPAPDKQTIEIYCGKEAFWGVCGDE